MSTRTFRDRVATFFKAYPNVWLDGREIAKVGGFYASRTRISECRTQLGMDIRNRVRRVGNFRVSEYMWVKP